MSGPALGFKHDRADRLGAGFAGPDDKLKSLVVAFACAHRAGENGSTLIAIQLGPAGGQNGMSEHDHSVIRPNVEMPDPELFVGNCIRISRFDLLTRDSKIIFRPARVKSQGSGLLQLTFARLSPAEQVLLPVKSARAGTRPLLLHSGTAVSKRSARIAGKREFRVKRKNRA
jgi:hypothetical protein